MKNINKILNPFWLICGLAVCGGALAHDTKAGYETDLKVQVLKKSGTTIDGEKIVYPSAENPEVTTLKITMAPGVETGWHYHPVPVFGYVLSGQLDVHMEDGKVNRFQAGDVIYEALNHTHKGINSGAEPLELIALYMGAEGVSNVIKVAPPEQ